MIHKRPRDRQHGDINPDPPATAQLQHAIIRKPYGLVPFFGYSTPKACLGARRTSLTTKNQDEIAWDYKEIPYSDANLPHFTEFLQHEIRRRRMNLTKRLPRAFFGVETLPIDQNKNIALRGHLQRHASRHPSGIHLEHTNAEQHL